MVTGWAALWIAATIAVAADPPLRDLPILFTADELTHDADLGITRASGRVEASRGDYVLVADTVTYNHRLDVLTASGNVALVPPSGDTFFADYMEVTGDLKDGILENFAAILSDGRRFAAAGARRAGGVTTEMAKAVYSPCDICPDDPTRPPLWQIKAVRVVHDQDEKIVEFEHAWLELGGVPVFYLPYLSQPDHTVKRKTGFLMPLFGVSSDLGFVAQLPFFWAISPHQDLTLAPAMTSSEGPLLEAGYRLALTRGRLDFGGSITHTNDDRTRGHVRGETRYDIDDTWRSGLDVDWSSDRAYLRKYGFDESRTPSLLSRAYAEGFGRRSYAAANGYYFDIQDDTIDQRTTPVAAPKLDFSFVGEPDALGGRTRFDAGLLALTRDQGNDIQRLSARAEWALPMVGPFGDLYTVSAALWGDGYHVRDFERSGSDSDYDGITGRVFPQASLKWQFPFVRVDEHLQQTLEPVVEFVAAPDYGNPSKIPNNDSESFELDENSIFGFNFYPGLDRVQQGPRVNYGLNWDGTLAGGGYARVFLGQTYLLNDQKEVSGAAALSAGFSDYVGVVRASPNRHFDALYRFRLDRNDLTPRRHELGSSIGVDAVRLETNYVFYDNEDTSEFRGREEISLSLRAQLSRHWRSRIFGTRDLTGGGAQRDLGLRLAYEDECLFFAAEFVRRDIEVDDVKASNAIFFRLGLKTLGTASTGFNFGGGDRSDDREAP
ncbi:MAG: LPS-assembly protein LptD [Rhodospirillales bacterium]